MTLGLGRFTGAVTTGAIFAMRNGTSKLLRVHRMVIQVGFSGVGNAQSTQIIQVKRFANATHSGGASLLANVVKHKSISPVASTLLDARRADITGTSPLTDTGVVYEAPFRNTMLPRSLSGLSVMQWQDGHDEILLMPSEGLAVVITETAVVGDSIVGLMCWEETDDAV